MIKLHHIVAATWLDGMRYRLAFEDGAAGVVDLAPELPPSTYAGHAIAVAPDRFEVAPRGRALVWHDAEGDEVDIDAETLRGLCEAQRQAAE